MNKASSVIYDRRYTNRQSRTKTSHPIKIKCPICGHKPMQQLDTGVSMSTLRVKLPEESMERVVGTLVFCCERCWNFQSFIKTSAEA